MELDIDRRIGAAAALRCGEEGAEAEKAKLSVKQSISVPTLTYNYNFLSD